MWVMERCLLEDEEALLALDLELHVLAAERHELGLAPLQGHLGGDKGGRTSRADC